MARKSSPFPKTWTPVATANGVHRGDYEVTDGELTVRLSGGGQKTVRAIDSHGDNGGLAAIVLHELAREGSAG